VAPDAEAVFRYLQVPDNHRTSSRVNPSLGLTREQGYHVWLICDTPALPDDNMHTYTDNNYQGEPRTLTLRRDAPALPDDHMYTYTDNNNYNHMRSASATRQPLQFNYTTSDTPALPDGNMHTYTDNNYQGEPLTLTLRRDAPALPDDHMYTYTDNNNYNHTIGRWLQWWLSMPKRCFGGCKCENYYMPLLLQIRMTTSAHSNHSND